MTNKFLMYGVGVDISKGDFHACVGGITIDACFKVKAQRKFKNSAKGYEEFVNWLSKHLKEKITTKILMEVTGIYHESLLYYLYDKGYNVYLEPGHRVKKYLSVLGYKSKTDKLDGKGMCQMVLERTLIKWKPVSASILKIRSLLRHRKALQKAKDQFGNQLHASTHSQIKDPYVLKSLSKVIKTLKKQIDELESRAMDLSKKDEAFHEKLSMIVNSTKGLGFISVLTVLSETNGFKTFRNRKQLESYAGYDVVENSSGKFVGRTRISKKGNANIRTVLYMAALSAVRAKSAPFYDLYTRLIARNGGVSKKANVAVQRKLLLIIYTLWTKNEAFDLKYYDKAA